ncbi:MAG: hypothetical protein R3E79_26550 [Caldilineaceae bacterium]
MKGAVYKPALADGFRFGFLGSSDTHASMPGRRHSLTKGTPGYGSRPYVTGIYAHENTRDAIFAALYHRRCYAATDRILLDFPGQLITGWGKQSRGTATVHHSPCRRYGALCADCNP